VLVGAGIVVSGVGIGDGCGFSVCVGVVISGWVGLDTAMSSTYSKRVWRFCNSNSPRRGDFLDIRCRRLPGMAYVRYNGTRIDRRFSYFDGVIPARWLERLMNL